MLEVIMRSISFSFILVTATACVTSQRLDPSLRPNIKNVSVTASELPVFEYYGPKAAFMKGIGVALGGAIGGALDSTGDTSDDAKFKQAMKKMNFDPTEVIVEKFSTQLERDTDISIAKSGPSDAHIDVKIPYFGLGKGWGFADQTKPYLVLNFEMSQGESKKIVWKETVRVATTDKESSYYSYEEWLQSENFLKVEFSKAIEVATRKAVDSLQR